LVFMWIFLLWLLMDTLSLIKVELMTDFGHKLDMSWT